MREETFKIISYCDIPEDIIKESTRVEEFQTGCYVPVQLEEGDLVSEYINNKYKIEFDTTVLIEIDY